MGRVSPSKQNRFGKSSTPAPVVPVAPKPTRTRAQMRRSSSSAAVERATSGGGTNPTRPVQDTGGEVVSAFQAPPVISRGEVRTNAKGVVQTGMNTGRKMTLGEANALLTEGYAIQDPFSSNQLPTTGSSLYQKTGSEAIKYEQNPEYNISTESTPTKLSTNMFESGSPLTMDNDGHKYQVSGASAPVSSTVSSDAVEDPKNSGTNWGARTAADNSDPNMARRRAFLDGADTGVGSMQALRRVEATQGIVYAGGQHHMLNPNRGQEGQNDFVSLDDKNDVRGYKSGRLSAQDMRDKYVTAITDANKTDGEEGITSNPSVTSEQPAALSPIELTSTLTEELDTGIKPKTKVQIPYNS